MSRLAEGEPTFELACRRIKETDKAVLLYDFASKEEIWIPLSQVFEMHFNKSSHEGTVVMSEWIAKQKGLTK